MVELTLPPRPFAEYVDMGRRWYFEVAQGSEGERELFSRRAILHPLVRYAIFADVGYGTRGYVELLDNTRRGAVLRLIALPDVTMLEAYLGDRDALRWGLKTAAKLAGKPCKEKGTWISGAGHRSDLDGGAHLVRRRVVSSALARPRDEMPRRLRGAVAAI